MSGRSGRVREEGEVGRWLIPESYHGGCAGRTWRPVALVVEVLVRLPWTRAPWFC